MNADNVAVLLAERSADLRTRFLDAIANTTGLGRIFAMEFCNCGWSKSLRRRFREVWNTFRPETRGQEGCSIMEIAKKTMPLADELQILETGWCTSLKKRHDEVYPDLRRRSVYEILPKWAELDTGLCLRCLRDVDLRQKYRHDAPCDHHFHSLPPSMDRQYHWSAINLVDLRYRCY